MISASLLGPQRLRDRPFRPRVSQSVVSIEIRQHIDCPVGTPQVRRMNLVQPADLRLRFSHFAQHAAKPSRPRGILGLAGRLQPPPIQLLGAGSLQRIDGWIERLDLPAQVLLFGDTAIHSIDIHRHELLAAAHQLLRQRAQQAEALLEQRKIFFDFKGHGLRHFVQFVLLFFFRSTDLWCLG